MSYSAWPVNMRTKSKRPLEQPPANLEEVKRRFIRQNRELAKANSTQSLRIRSLEIENSRLLDEILRLRERNLWLERERQNAQVNASSEAIQRFKDELQMKFAELSGFLDELVRDENHTCDENYLLPKEKLLSPSQRQYRERQPLAELMQECVMPTIAENKIFTQQAPGTEDSRGARTSDHSSNGSPDLGPPPVARFDYGSSAELEPSHVQEPPLPINITESERENETLPTNLSVNLETRRRKREGQGRIEVRRHTILETPSDQSDSQPGNSILRTGAKRKLSDRDSEKPIRPPTKDDFTFSRKPLAPTGQAVDEDYKSFQSASEGISTSILEASQAKLSPPRQTRRVLGSKSTNLSPRKAQPKIDKIGKDESEKSAPPKLTINRQRAPIRSRRTSSLTVPPPSDEVPAVAELLPQERPTANNVVDLPPKTPATADLFSPSTCEDSAKQPIERSDTPPPADLSNISNTTEGGQRPSRRARSAVNYTEPSLVAKMRRPGKEMVDAITGLQDPRRTMNAPGTSRKSQGAQPMLGLPSQPTSMKKEALTDGNDSSAPWHSITPGATAIVRELDPGSPLNSRTTLAQAAAASDSSCSLPLCLPAPSETGAEEPINASSGRSGSSVAISALIASSSSSTSSTSSAAAARHQRRRETTTGLSVSFDVPASTQGSLREDVDEAARKRIEEMSLYEFKAESSSSPADEANASSRVARRRATAGFGSGMTSASVKAAGTQRRHSAMLKETATADAVPSVSVAARGAKAASRRRSTFV